VRWLGKAAGAEVGVEAEAEGLLSKGLRRSSKVSRRRRSLASRKRVSPRRLRRVWSRSRRLLRK
jgi:hypothetical protein